MEPGLYRLQSFAVRPDSADLATLPYGDAQNLTVELSDDRSEAIIRYERNGSSVEERWSVQIIP